MARSFLALMLVLLAAGLVTSCAGRPRTAATPAEEERQLVQVDVADSPPGFHDAVQSAAGELFGEGASLSVAPRTVEDAHTRLTLSLGYRNLTEAEFETIWRATTFFLLTLYPSTCLHRAYELNATLSGPDGVSRTYQETDNTVAWIWLFQGPRCGDAPGRDEVRAVASRMLAALRADMRRDHALAKVLHGAIGPEPPMVLLSANRAADILEQVARIERPFANWSVMAPDGRQPDYLLDIHFDVRQGDFSIGRAYLGIMTGGLSTLGRGLCNATQVSLDATVSSPHLEKSRSYRFTDAVATHVGDAAGNCERIDEGTRPDVFAALLRTLFRQVGKDGLIRAPDRESTVPHVPLVAIDAQAVEGPVREATLRGDPFPRYIFGAMASVSADYRLKISVDTSGGGVSKNTTRKVTGIFVYAWSGIDITCLPTRFDLHAHVLDRDGSEVRRYDFGRAFDFSGTSVACVDTVDSNPRAVVTLVRDLYRRMQQDGTAKLLSGDKPVAARAAP